MRMIVLICLFWVWTTAAVQAVEIFPGSPSISAKSYILQDFHSEQILLEKNTKQRLEPASLTKLMTAYVVFSALKEGHIKLEDEVHISKKAWQMKGSRMYLERDSTVTVEELIKGMIIQSGNDASMALAEYVAGDEENFVKLMNEQAKVLGLSDTQYMNSTGLSNTGHYSTAYDLATMARAIIRDFPDYYRWYSEKEYTHNNITQSNRNLLLWRDNSVDGMKTGYTDNAGYCLIASAKRDGMRLISVVLGAGNKKERATQSQKLLDFGYRFYKTYKLYPARQAITSERVWKGSSRNVNLGLVKPLYITIPKGQYQNLKATLQIDNQIIAPVYQSREYGMLKISLQDKLLLSRPLVALNGVDSGNVLQQLVDYLWLQFQ
ncbi:D-alanyl-D-alanine carboxypeptidase family protein [Candidatus Albibeggiatoa sp. nov. NOAA]|uniref:D-alanyl-D-alanine carboxypeptidase family protein n=1 Tax=Candidatus Albibeggiatoa sp. nov. NOAA TaxID=3162724 RepID=UPI0032F81137|nr:D-alanyl-D-alanine carboxypeptidase [Thiotrichaceae bacterium]